MAIKCTECGASIQDDSKFCQYCGAKLPEEAKIDIKKREYKIETINHTRMHKAEVKKELAQAKYEAKLKAEKEKEELALKKKELEAKQDKRFFILIGAILVICLIIFLITNH